MSPQCSNSLAIFVGNNRDHTHNLIQNTLIKINMSRISKYWTGKPSDNSKILPPTSNNYEEWRADQVKKECTHRELRINKSVGKAVRIECLREYDKAKERQKTTKSAPQRSASCNLCLLNLLFDDEFCEDFSQLGNSKTREYLDAMESTVDKFWDRVEKSYMIQGKYTDLIAEDDWFKFDRDKIIPHSASKLKYMWHDLRREYIKCLANSTRSGTHEIYFKKFCKGMGDVLYLHHWLNVKPNLITHVDGGFLEQDKFDSNSNWQLDDKSMMSFATDNIEKCGYDVKTVKIETTPKSSRLKDISPGSKENQKVDQGMLEVASSVRYHSDNYQKDSGILSLEKTCLQNDIDEKIYIDLENMTHKIISAQNELNKIKSNQRCGGDLKCILKENIMTFSNRRQKIYQELNSDSIQR